MIRSYLTAWIPAGKPTYEEVFWARVGGIGLPFVLLSAVEFDALSTTWLAVGFAGYLCVPVTDRTAEERQHDHRDYTLPEAFGVAIVALLAGVALSTAPVENAIGFVRGVAPTVVDAIGGVDFAALTIGGIYGVFAKTLYRWLDADDVQPPD